MKRVGLGAILACLALFATACPKRTPAAVSRSGGWHLVETPRVRLETDLPLDNAKERAVELEQEIAGLLYVYQLLSPRPAPALRPTRVIVFSDCESFYTVAFGAGLGGYVREGNDLEEERVAIMCDRVGGDLRMRVITRIQVFRHELAHVLNGYYFANLPRWFNEGLAEYFGGLRVYRGTVQLGHPPLYKEGWRESPISFEALRTSEWKRDRAHYHAAWKAAYALLTTSPKTRDQAIRFLAELAAGTPEPAAWDKTMKGVDSEVKKTFAAWKPLKDYKVWEVPFPTPPTVTTKVRDMSTLEVAARMVEISILRKGAKPGPWDKQLTDALANLQQLDTAGDTALFWRAVAAYYTAREDIGDPKTLFEQYRAKRPDDPRGHLGWLFLSLRGIPDKPSEEQLAALAAMAPTVAKLVPVATSPLALDAVATYWVLRQKPQAAFPFVYRALAKDPSCWQCYETLAAIRFIEGKHAEAVQAQERAIGMLSDATPSKVMIERLATYRTAAASKATPPPPPSTPPTPTP